MTKEDLQTRSNIAAIIAIGRHNSKSSMKIAEEIMTQATPSADVLERTAQLFEECGEKLYWTKEIVRFLRGNCKKWVCQ